MLAWLGSVVVAMVVFFQPFSYAMAAEVSCVCEELTCKECETQTNLTFYTSKCGSNNSRVKSCKRPTCVAVPNQKQCLADLKSKDPAVIAAQEEAKRKLAAEAEASKTEAPAPIGSISNLFGIAKLSRLAGSKVNAEVNLNVFEGDEIETEKTGKVRVAFHDGNVLNIAPETKVTIEKHSREGGRRKTLLNLMYGKMRSQVNKNNKYDDQTSYFRVKTKSAVAGVRGTDFVTTFIPGDKNWITKVQTLEGKVRFGGEGPSENQDARPKEVVGHDEIKEGYWAAFSIPAPKGDNITDLQLNSYIQKGTLSKPELIKKSDLEELDKATDYKNLAADSNGKEITRSVASVEALCRAPEGEFGNCSYTCEGEGCSECMRRSCNAGGAWGLPTKIERSYCDPSRAVVRSKCY